MRALDVARQRETLPEFVLSRLSLLSVTHVQGDTDLYAYPETHTDLEWLSWTCPFACMAIHPHPVLHCSQSWPISGLNCMSCLSRPTETVQ